ncbi:MAG: hypothetical protein ABUS57_07875 [Pseudomonadota bacterium]
MSFPPANTTNLWNIARRLIALMAIAIGGPVAIAKAGRLSRKGRREILDWLAPLEVLVRKLVFIEAMNLPLPAEQGARVLTKKLVAAWSRARPAPPRAIDPEKPATWRVSFKLALSRRRRAPPTQRMVSRLGPPLLVRDVWRDRAARMRLAARNALANGVTPSPRRLALRYEAVRRVIANPTAAAMRLARELRKRDADLRNPHKPLPRELETSIHLAARIIFAPQPRRAPDFSDTRIVDEAARRSLRRLNSS